MSEAERDFFSVNAVFSSPLTRALQTTLLALDGHPSLAPPSVASVASVAPPSVPVAADTAAVAGKAGQGPSPRRRRVPITLLGSVREVKHAGGVDSRGAVQARTRH